MNIKFDSQKDKVLKYWNIPQGLDKFLVVKVAQYGEGTPKIQIGPSYVLRKDKGKIEKVWVKTGRLDIDTTKLLIEALLEAIEFLK